jgi:hypothetical protein
VLRMMWLKFLVQQSIKKNLSNFKIIFDNLFSGCNDAFNANF